jgi:putative nucleotidyltransferase with HDIG domain
VQIEGQGNHVVEPPWAHFRTPPFPQIAIRVLQLAQEENSSMLRLCELISSDAAFASEVLTIANSALYARRVPVTSILQAIALLGTHSLKGVCLTVGVRAYLGKALDHPVLRAIWRHNLACALIAKELALLGLVDKDTAYTAGLMHDIGRLALVVLKPKEYAALLESHCGSASSMLQQERELFGLDHCEAGRHLTRDWRLPAEFEAIVFEHHTLRQKSAPWHMADLINVSCRLADTVGFPAFPRCEFAPYAELLDELPMRERSLFHPEVEKLAIELSSKINSIESV